MRGDKACFVSLDETLFVSLECHQALLAVWCQRARNAWQTTAPIAYKAVYIAYKAPIAYKAVYKAL